MVSHASEVKQVGLDVHKHFSRVTARDASGKVLFRQRLEHADRSTLRAEFASWPKGTPVVLEGTFGWGWMADDLAASGLEPHLTSGSKTHAWRMSHSQAKNNRLDADLLSELMSERTRWWEVWLAPASVRQQREWLRYRQGLVQTQTCFKNRIQAVLHRHGIILAFSDLFGKKGREALASLIEPKDTRLPTSAKTEIAGSLRVLDLLRRLIAQVTRAWRKELHAGSLEKDVTIWKSLPGVGWILACTIQAEIGDLHRFKNAGRLATYSLLAPRDNDSGEEDPTTVPAGRHVGRRGRRTLKWAFLQAALSAVKKSPSMRELFNRLTDQGKRQRMRGYVAVAHRLCVIGYACCKDHRPFSEKPPARAGHASGQGNAHSEAGGPVPAMVAASR